MKFSLPVGHLRSVLLFVSDSGFRHTPFFCAGALERTILKPNLDFYIIYKCVSTLGTQKNAFNGKLISKPSLKK